MWRRYRYKIILGLWLLMFLGFLTAAAEKKYGWWNGKDDLRLAVLASDSVGIVSISPSRRMINVFRTKGEAELWIPGGLSWYRSDRIKRIVESEHLYKEVDKIFFYNFGFRGDTIMVLDKFEDWNTSREMILKIGLHNWIRYRMAMKNMLTKEDVFGQRLDETDVIEEVFLRDFSDDRLLDEQLRVTVINASELPGMASWLASRLDWMGLSVVGLETSSEKVDKCRFVVPSEEVKSLKSFEIMSQMWDCEVKVEPNFDPREIEILLGGKFGEMVEYSSYHNQ